MLLSLLREGAAVATAKKSALLRVRDEITTLVLGSSHGDFGFDPTYCPGAFNLCTRSQDLKYSSLLYRHAADNCPRLENLVIIFSVFSPGCLTELSPSENILCPMLNTVFGLGVRYADERLETLGQVIGETMPSLAFELEGCNGFFPDFGKGWLPPSLTATARADQHLRLNRKTDALTYLSDMFTRARTLGHRVLVVIPPARSDYRAAVQAATDPFASLHAMIAAAETPVEVLNCFEDRDYTDTCFGDTDHLLPMGPGARLLSLQVRARITLPTDAGHACARYGLARIALDGGQFEASLPHFIAAINADPVQAPYWLGYIDALIQADAPDEARAVLALARQHGLEGDAADALAGRLLPA